LIVSFIIKHGTIFLCVVRTAAMHALTIHLSVCPSHENKRHGKPNIPGCRSKQCSVQKFEDYEHPQCRTLCWHWADMYF